MDNEIGPVTVADVSGQRIYQVERLPAASTVDDVVQRLLGPMQAPPNDAEGRPLGYGIRSDREGRLLGGNERVEDVVLPNDRLTLMPQIDAGRG